MRSKKALILLISALSITLISACLGGKVQINCPFTELTWDTTEEEMKDLEGEKFESYDSIYKGTTYTYPRTYLETEGIVKYMYDDKGKLCNVSWSYTGDDETSLMNVYNAVVDDMTKLHGESKNDDGVGNYCEMWITDNGTVMANAVITNDTKVMQIAYMNEDVSKQGKGDQ